MTATPEGPGGTVVAGVDGSDWSVAALAWAFGQAERTGSRLEAIIAWRWPFALGTPVAFGPGYDPAADALRVLEAAVVPLAARFPSVPVRTRTVEGHPAVVLVEASRNATLLVVGSRGHGMVSGALLGSVSQHCAAHATSPVLVHRLRPDA